MAQPGKLLDRASLLLLLRSFSGDGDCEDGDDDGEDDGDDDDDGEYNHLIAQNVILVADFAIFRRGGGGSTELRQDIALIQVLFPKFSILS